VGVAGVAGNGQLQLAETLAGLRRPVSGTILVDDVEIGGRGPRAARDAGLAYVPQDRLGTGLAPRLPILDNIRLTKRLPFFIADAQPEAAARDAIDLYAIKARGPRDVTGRLSGGNVQKVLLARELGAGAVALVVASPTRGLDIAAIEFVRDLLDGQRAAGVSILLISEDLDEIRDLADRIVVMHSGRFVLECDAADCDLTELGMAMAGRKGAGQ
jgi:simple sugar transport system ATP-binding protein